MESEVLGCGYSYHDTPFSTNLRSRLSTYLFRLQTEGSSHVLVHDRSERLTAGDLLLCKPGDAYELTVGMDSLDKEISSGDYYLFARGPWVQQWWERSEKPRLCRIDMDERLLTLWRQLYWEKHRMEREDPELISYLFRALCVSIERAVMGYNTPRKPGDENFVAQRMQRYIVDHATATFRVEDVAQHVGLSVSRASHLFKDYFGFTMIQYAVEVRLSIALERMQYTSMTLEQIAHSCGFGSYPYFHKMFKARYGESPRERRRVLIGGRGEPEDVVVSRR